MRLLTGWTLLLLAATASGQDTGFLPEQPVREPTRLDWEFVAGPTAPLPGNYHSRRQRYQLFVPSTYNKTRSWPLVLFVSPGDDPLAWRAWQTPCEEAGYLFAAPYGVGNACPPGQRIRAVLDVLDDVRRHYRIDPERTYLAGIGGGAEMACRIAFALPEYVGGVIAVAGDVPLPRLAHLRHRLRDRLSVALVCGQDDSRRPLQQRYLAPLLRDLGIRSRLWIVPDERHGLPPAKTLVEVQTWLDDDRKRRQDDAAAAALDVDDTPTRRQLASRALVRAQKELRDPDRLYPAASLLEWVVARGGIGEAAEKAKELLQRLREDDVQGRLLLKYSEAELCAGLTARGQALESLGDLDAARRAWDGIVRLADGDERAKATRELRRLTDLVAQTPYLGVTFAGGTTTIRAVSSDGPAERAGVQFGDVLERVGKVKVTTQTELREQFRRLKPGDELAVGLLREGKAVTLLVRLGASPRENDAP